MLLKTALRGVMAYLVVITCLRLRRREFDSEHDYFVPYRINFQKAESLQKCQSTLNIDQLTTYACCI